MSFNDFMSKEEKLRKAAESEKSKQSSDVPDPKSASKNGVSGPQQS